MVPRSRPEVVLLTREECGFCHDAEEILVRLSSEFGFDVTRLDLDSQEGYELGQREGILFPPGILIDGEGVSYGRPSERRLRRELERRLQETKAES
ncbi:MAG: glutaredoxin [Actinomycetota bacterium]|nr:glutaredoxin [Actinomycetota bacterium]MDP9327837.1 glutaredoxin [Actinomycetota bacterium]